MATKSISVDGVDPDILLTKILEAIDKGHTTDEIRENPMKFIVSGKTKKIVICTGGEGLKLSYEIINEMANRGDQLAKKLIDDDKRWCKINNYQSSRCKLSEIPKDERSEVWIHYRDQKLYNEYDRTNEHLINIIEEDEIQNIGGWTLQVYTVYDEDWSYQIHNQLDGYGSEYIVGNIIVD